MYAVARAERARSARQIDVRVAREALSSHTSCLSSASPGVGVVSRYRLPRLIAVFWQGVRAAASACDARAHTIVRRHFIGILPIGSYADAQACARRPWRARAIARGNSKHIRRARG